MNEEEKELINNIERALNLSEVKGDLVTIIYNYIVKATINLINKLQKELDKKDKLIELIYNLFFEYISIRPMSGIKFLNDKGFSKCKNCEKELEDENGISCKDCIKEQFIKKVEEENE